MKLKKAIEILLYLARVPTGDLNLYEYNAIKLGIEALKRVEDIRSGKVTMISIPLLGETENDNELGGGEEEEEEFEYRSEGERVYASRQLASRCSVEDVLSISVGEMPVPKWLQKEIIKRREVK